MDLFIHLLLLLSIAPPLTARRHKYIVPGATWLDTDGNVLHAHAGGITEVDGTWYWFGQNEEAEQPLFSGINVYSSSDLTNWKYEGKALSPSDTNPVVGPDSVVERPKVVFSEPLQSWVLWFHSDDPTYSTLKQGYALSPNITGPYTFVEAISPLGSTSQDFGLFLDDDGQAYSLFSNGDAESAHDNLIVRLTDNFTAPAEIVYIFPDMDLEAPAIVRTDEKYYIIMSHKTGYRPNNDIVFSARNLRGPWSIQSYIAELGTRTWNSQSTMTLKIKGSEQTTYLYAGDNWATGSTLYDSRYVWLPMKIDDRTSSLAVDWHDVYGIDTKTGLLTFPGGTSYEAEDGVVTGGAAVVDAPTASGYQVVTGIQAENSTITIRNITGTGNPQWVTLRYHNPDGLWGDNRGGNNITLARNAVMYVNDAASPIPLRQQSGSSGIILSLTVNVTFNEGSGNSLRVGGMSGGVAADLDRIIVYDDIYED